MSLPPELRALCFQLSNTPASNLPSVIPALLRQALRCQVPLSSSSENFAKADASASSVLVHRLKTQLSTLLNGKSLEGRFAAVVLIKGVVEVGGWEVLRGCESWVRGLLSILSKPDSPATKELCILTLTKIYCMTHEYQTLIREITTPTLPAFITACLNIISSPSKGSSVVPSLIDVVFRAFAILLPRHSTIYRPFTSQIRTIAKPYLAPTLLNGFVPSSLQDSARRIFIASHLTVAKGGGGEEWSKAVRDLIRDVHMTADKVFRAVVEDWESTAGYHGDPIDVNQELAGGGKNADDLPRWNGIDSGVERIVGLLGILEEYFENETSTPVSIPLGPIVDLFTRMLSIAIPDSSGHGGVRLHPAIDRDERDGLWSGIPQIYTASLQLINAIADRLQENFQTISQTILDQLIWAFPSGKHDPDFRIATYLVVEKILLHIGPSLGKETLKLSSIIRSCCNDLHSAFFYSEPSFQHGLGTQSNSEIKNVNGKRPAVSQDNADSFSQKPSDVSSQTSIWDPALVAAANRLLPLLISRLPQQFLDISLRSMVDRTGILSRNKEAMLAAVLNPFVRKDGKPVTTILPYLTREFDGDLTVETLLRPRMPLTGLGDVRLSTQETTMGISEDEEMDEDIVADRIEEHDEAPPSITSFQQPVLDTDSSSHGLGVHPQVSIPTPFTNAWGPSASSQPSTIFANTLDEKLPILPMKADSSTAEAVTQSSRVLSTSIDVKRTEAISDSDDDESVHLTMALDTDSEEDAEI